MIMLDMQDAMNARVNADWRNAGNAWYRAMKFDEAKVYRQRNTTQLGLSVRCVKDQ